MNPYDSIIVVYFDEGNNYGTKEGKYPIQGTLRG